MDALKTLNFMYNDSFGIACMWCTLTSDWSSAEAPPQLVLASGQGNGIPGITDICAPRPGSKKLHVSL